MKARKILAMVAALALTAALAVGGTLAYLTSTKTVTNTFTVGSVQIKLDEAQVNQDGTVKKDADGKVLRTDIGNLFNDETGEGGYKLMPGHFYTKDPKVTVAAGSEDSYLFVKVQNGISEIEAAGDTTIANQMAAKGWVKVEDTDNVYCYYGIDAESNTVNSGKAIVVAGQEIQVFDSFTISGDVIGGAKPADAAEDDNNLYLADYATAQIVVTAYAIQADGFEGSTPAQIWAEF